MQFLTSLLLGLSAIAGTQAQPVEERSDSIYVAHFTLHGGPASYDLYVPTDGTVINTGTF